MEIHKKIFDGDQKFKDKHRPIEHYCRKEDEKLKYNTLIETNIQGEPKEYTVTESFQNRTTLQ